MNIHKHLIFALLCWSTIFAMERDPEEPRAVGFISEINPLKIVNRESVIIPDQERLSLYLQAYQGPLRRSIFKAGPNRPLQIFNFKAEEGKNIQSEEYSLACKKVFAASENAKIEFLDVEKLTPVLEKLRERDEVGDIAFESKLKYYLEACKTTAPNRVWLAFMPSSEHLQQLTRMQEITFIVPYPQEKEESARLDTAIKLLRYPNILLDLYSERSPHETKISLEESSALYKKLGLSEAIPLSPELEKLLSYMDEFKAYSGIAAFFREINAKCIEEREAQTD